MVWTEAGIIAVHNRMCNKYRPRECSKCPLKRWSGCQIGVMIDEIKSWAEKNVPEWVLEGKNL